MTGVQTCALPICPKEAVNKTIELYGLGIDCQYHITEVIDLDKEGIDLIKLY